MNPPVQLTREETRVLEDCQRESFIYRSVPFGVCSYFLTLLAMSKNYITPKAKWVKLGGAVFFGAILGKVSYTSTCRQKILNEIPNSGLAQLIRGVEEHQDAKHSHPDKQAHDHLVFAPDAQHIPVAVNQYGDPIYKSN